MAYLGACGHILLVFGQYTEEILITMVPRGSKITLTVLMAHMDTPNNIHIGLYCVFGLKKIIDFRTLFSTTKCFGSKKFARVSHKEFNSLWFDEAKKKIRHFLGRRVVRG